MGKRHELEIGYYAKLSFILVLTVDSVNKGKGNGAKINLQPKNIHRPTKEEFYTQKPGKNFIALSLYPLKGLSI